MLPPGPLADANPKCSGSKVVRRKGFVEATDKSLLSRWIRRDNIKVFATPNTVFNSEHPHLFASLWSSWLIRNDPTNSDCERDHDKSGS
jgi:hypothetical protein